jgi:hypothetical protein
VIKFIGCIIYLILLVIKSRRKSWEGLVTLIWEGRNFYRFLVWRAEGKRPLGR